MQALPPHQDIMTTINNQTDSSTVALPGHEDIMQSALKMPKFDPFNAAATSASQKYGVNISSNFLSSIFQQESSGQVDPTNYNLSMGVTPAAKKSLGKDYLPDNSFENVVQNAANYVASRAKFTLDNGQKVDLSTPENLGKLYLQRYVGLLPGQTRVIGGKKVSYNDIMTSFTGLLNKK